MSDLNNQNNAETVQAGQVQTELLDQLLKPEVQESLVTLIDQLPKLTEMVIAMNKSYEFAQSIATDEVLKNDTVGAVKEIAVPVADSMKHIAKNVLEAKERAEASNEVFGLFGILKMMKDPQAQKLFRFMNAYLQVAAEQTRD